MKNELKTGEEDLLDQQYGYKDPNDLIALIDREIFGIEDNPRMEQGFAVPANAVDVVEISLREAAAGPDLALGVKRNDDSVVNRQLAWLLSDGSVTDFKTGTSNGIRFYGQNLGHDKNFHVVVRHRNHLTIMSKALPVNYTGADINLADSTGNIFGSINNMSKIGMVYTVPAGDVDNNQTIDVHDRNETRTDSQRGEDGYRSSNGLSTDANLSGRVNAADLNLVEKNLPRQLSSVVPNP